MTWSYETVFLPSSSSLRALGAVVALTGAPSGAAAALKPKPSAGSQDALARVGELFRSGQDRFETADFEGAITLWTQAYQELPDGAEHQAIRAMLLANLAQAHVQAHAIGGDVDHLRQADGLFTDYLSMIDPEDAQTRQTIEEEQKRIAQLLAEADEQAEQDQAAEREPPEPEPEPEPEPDDRVEPVGAGSSLPPGGRRRAFVPYTRWERAMVIGGGVTLAITAALTGATLTFLWLQDQEESDGEEKSRDPSTTTDALRDISQDAHRFNNLAISTGAVTSIMGVIGLGLVGAALARRNRRLKANATLIPSPSGPTLSIRGRF